MIKIKAYRVTGRELRKSENGEWQENMFEIYTFNPKKIERGNAVVIGELTVEPVKAVIPVTDDMLIDAIFEPCTRKRKVEEVTEESENA